MTSFRPTRREPVRPNPALLTYEQAEVLIERLGVKAIADPPNQSLGGLLRGKRMRNPMFRTFQILFEANELARKMKMTDYAMRLEIEKEFPRCRLKKWWDRERTHSVNQLRMNYMRGQYTQGFPPRFISFRYDEHGRRVNFRSGTRLLTREESDRYIARWDEFWRREEGKRQERFTEILSEYEDCPHELFMQRVRLQSNGEFENEY